MMKAEDIFGACRHKQTTIEIEGLPEPLEIIELSVGARMSLTDIEDSARRQATIVRYGVPLLREIPEEELIDRLPFDAMIEISSAVLDLSGVGEDSKKSD
jgi:hypothetical protein